MPSSSILNVYFPGISNINSDCRKIANIFKKIEMPLVIFNFYELFKAGNLDIDSICQEINNILDAKEYKQINLVGYSFGAAVVLEYIGSKYDQNKIKNIILIDPLLKPIDSYFKKFFFRICDMFIGPRENYGKKILGYFRRVFFLMEERKIILKINFDKNIDTSAKITFIWGERDMTCPLSDFYSNQGRFSNFELIMVEKFGHDWISSSKLLNDYLLPVLNGLTKTYDLKTRQ